MWSTSPPWLRPAKDLSSVMRPTRRTTQLHFGTAVDVTVAELRLEAFLPADQATASILTRLGQATPQRA